MARFSRSLGIAALALGSSPAWAQAPAAQDLLTRADAVIFTAKSYRLSGTSTTTPAAPGGDSIAPFLVAASNGRIHSEEGSGKGLHVYIFDGATRSDYFAADNTYRQGAAIPADPPPIELLRYGRNSANLVSASVEGQEEIYFAGVPASCYIVRASYRGAAGRPGARNVVRTVRIARESELIVRDSWEMEVPAAGSWTPLRIEYNFDKIEWDVPLPDGLFVFHPPAGGTVRPPQSFTPPQTAGGGGGGGRGGSIRAGTAQPVVLQRVAPEYTAEARAEQLQGSVLVSVPVDGDGSPLGAQVVRGLGFGLDAMAIDSVKKWRFTAKDGKPATRVVEVDFRLPDGGPWHLEGAYYGAVVPRNTRPSVVTKPVLRKYAVPDSAGCRANADYASVQFRIQANGTPTEVKVVGSSADAAGQAAVKAIEAWRFEPARADRRAIEGGASVFLECDNWPSGSAEPVSVNRVGSGITAPAIIFKIEPEYSEEARKAKYQGKVDIHIYIDSTGRASDFAVISALGLGLDEKAIEAVAQWRFKPGTKDGQPVQVEATVEVNFKLL